MRRKVKSGEFVIHRGKKWKVDTVITQGRDDNLHKSKAYISAFPMCGKQVLFRSGKIIGNDWK